MGIRINWKLARLFFAGKGYMMSPFFFF